MGDWTPDIDDVLNNIRINSLLLANKHKARYFELKDSLKWYRLPVIVLNGANSIISVKRQGVPRSRSGPMGPRGYLHSVPVPSFIIRKPPKGVGSGVYLKYCRAGGSVRGPFLGSFSF